VNKDKHANHEVKQFHENNGYVLKLPLRICHYLPNDPEREKIFFVIAAKGKYLICVH